MGFSYTNYFLSFHCDKVDYYRHSCNENVEVFPPTRSRCSYAMNCSCCSYFSLSVNCSHGSLFALFAHIEMFALFVVRTVRTIWLVRTVRCSHCSHDFACSHCSLFALFGANSANERTANTSVRSSVDPDYRPQKYKIKLSFIIYKVLQKKRY